MALVIESGVEYELDDNLYRILEEEYDYLYFCDDCGAAHITPHGLASTKER